MKIIENAADVTKQITTVERAAKKLDKNIHTIAVSCLYHADKHGDVTLMQNLITAMGRSQRKNALIGWASAMGKFSPDEKGKNVVHSKTNNTDLEGAMETSPWDFAPEKAFKPFDLNEALDNLLKRAKAAAKDERNNVPAEALEEITKLAQPKLKEQQAA